MDVWVYLIEAGAWQKCELIGYERQNSLEGEEDET